MLGTILAISTEKLLSVPGNSVCPYENFNLGSNVNILIICGHYFFIMFHGSWATKVKIATVAAQLDDNQPAFNILEVYAHSSDFYNK